MKQPDILDNYPLYRPAGFKPPGVDEGADYCIRPEQRIGLTTPDYIKRYRKSSKNATGVTITHYGKIYDQLPPETHTYGVQTLGSDHVPHVLTDKGLGGLPGYMRNIKEEKYQRNLKEPLGQGITRNYAWPSKTQTNGFRFGVATIGSESSKDVMYTPTSLNTSEQDQARYLKSHHTFEAGQQKDRNYKWPFDKTTHAFGRSEKLVNDEGKYCLQPETVGEIFPQTKIVKKNVEDWKDYGKDPLGKPKNLAQTNPYVGADHVYGYKPKDNEPWNVAKCITGEAFYKQVKEDDALGKSSKFGFRNITKDGDEDRIFGLPTIRSDIPKPVLKSIADPFNYGDEPPSVGLLFPQRFADMGVNPSDFEVLRPKEEIRKMFANIGFGYKPGKFEGVFMRAQDICGTQQDQVSVKAFIQAIRELGNVE